ncbi:MAG: hypothetical protein BGN87_05265 [Rhizobiales bacterium 65-79]|jgi:hypothetical protein|nr:MAG: hypothetical protein BGN87_05265 [Rhizobiales bacterium 65-79]
MLIMKASSRPAWAGLQSVEGKQIACARPGVNRQYAPADRRRGKRAPASPSAAGRQDLAGLETKLGW